MCINVKGEIRDWESDRGSSSELAVGKSLTEAAAYWEKDLNEAGEPVLAVSRRRVYLVETRAGN